MSINDDPPDAPPGRGRIWGREPVLLLAIIQAVIAAVVAFGLDLTADQVAAVMAVAAAVLGFAARSRVSPA